jgi:two-component sensor histidine kinase
MALGVSTARVARLQMVKGWVFVLLTTGLVYFLTRAYARRKDAALAETTALSRELQRAVEQKQAMIRELHHRVKNNLQIVVALINLTASADDLETTRRRIYAMAESHDIALALEEERRIDIDRTIEHLVARLIRPHLPPGSKIEITSELPFEGIPRLPIGHIVPLGIYLTEVTRLLLPLHSVDPGPQRLVITSAGDESRWELQVQRDEASQLRNGKTDENPSETTTALCEALAGQLGGTVTVAPRVITMHVPVKIPAGISQK